MRNSPPGQRSAGMRKTDTTSAIAQELAEALDMLLSVAADKRTILPKGELYTNMALNGARQALSRAKGAGIEPAP